MTLDGLLFAVLLFLLRVINYAISTIRMVAITRNLRLIAAVLAFIEAFIFIVVIANVINDLEDNLLNLMAYCLGAAIGSWVGMILESRLITSFRIVNITTHVGGHDLAVTLREAGYGVTEALGQGRDGEVTILSSVVTSKQITPLLKQIRQQNPDAFVAIEEARAVRQGWIKQTRLHRR